MFRKATPTMVRRLRRGAVASSLRRGAAQRIALASSSSILSNGSAPFTARFKSSVAIEEEVCVPTLKPPFKKILAANRGEIATRINRAGAELGAITAGIYSYEGTLFHFYESDGDYFSDFVA
jgi:pyruvate carboxylase